MKHYKLNSEVYAFEENGSQDFLIKDTMSLMTEAEVELHLNPPKTSEEFVAEANQVEFQLLDELDKQSMRDIRKWIAAQSTAPQSIKDYEASAIIARGKIK